MDDKFSNGKVFSLSAEHFTSPCILDNISLYQAGENVMERGGEIYSHTQECHEISYIISGCAEVYVNGKKTTLQKGDVHIISKGTEHKIIADDTQRLRYFFLGFDFSSRKNDCYDEISAYYSSIKNELLHDSGDIYVMVNQIIKEIYSYDNKYHSDILEVLIKSLLLYVYFLHQKRITPSTVNADEKNIYISGTVFNIVKFVDANIVTITRISDIAKKFNYSPAYISRIFKEKMGITLREYVNKKKVEASIELLKSGKFSVSEVADRLHFDSYRSFYRKFKHIVGISPTLYNEK